MAVIAAEFPSTNPMGSDEIITVIPDQRPIRNWKLGNEVANLPQKLQLCRRWAGCFFIHPCLVAGLNKLFQHFFQ
jgi:hypothetical protein